MQQRVEVVHILYVKDALSRTHLLYRVSFPFPQRFRSMLRNQFPYLICFAKIKKGLNQSVYEQVRVSDSNIRVCFSDICQAATKTKGSNRQIRVIPRQTQDAFAPGLTRLMQLLLLLPQLRTACLCINRQLATSTYTSCGS